jgi:hypothetical protein
MFGSINYYLAGGGAAAPVPFGCATYTTSGTFTFTVPSGVSKISVVCVGAGYQGYGNCNPDCDPGGYGGGGGNLAYTNCIPVTPGESLSVKVGSTSITCRGCCSCPNNSSNYSTIKRGCTVLNSSGTGSYGRVGTVSYRGGGTRGNNNTSGGGGGAAGYAGNGGTGSTTNTYAPCGAKPGAGGGGGGGAWVSGNSAYGGGGVGIIVQGPSGAAGVGSGGGGGSSGSPGTCAGGAYGGGGAGGGNGSPGPVGAKGGVRIIYGGTVKSYPNTSAP